MRTGAGSGTGSGAGSGAGSGTGSGAGARIGADLAAALGLLTRLPVRIGPAAMAGGGGAAWAWPLAGVVVGTFAGIAALLATAIGFSPGISAALALVTQVMLTGALHEDGLADCADGLWGGHTVARRLAIMTDSRIGSYGVLALVLVLLIRWQAIAALTGAGAVLPALIAAGALSRVPMAAIMAALPNARGHGLSASVGRPGPAAVGTGAAVALALALALCGWAGVSAALAASVAGVAVALIARARIGGQTGDVLGASQQVAEAAILLALIR